MNKRALIFISAVLMVAFVASATEVSFAFNGNVMATSVLHSNLQKTVARLSEKVQEEVEQAQQPKVSCLYDVPEKPVYSANTVEVRKKLRVNTDEEFRVKVFVKNTGNTPWFSLNSKCTGPIVNLGTDFERDHNSALFSPEINKSDNNWVGANRVGLDQLRVEPGEVASFTFWAKASKDPDVYKEFMTPVVEGIMWIDGARVSFDTMIGDVGEDPSKINQKRLLAGNNSGSVMGIDLDAEKKILVDLSDQEMQVYLGDIVVREFKVSTGAAKTPTPVGNYIISLKQDVRIGGKAPHYVMPNFMMFRKDGYGIHALPSLSRRGGDLFWTEARSHIGIPVSHGCIRTLPEDSDFVYGFTDIGTKVVVQR